MATFVHRVRESGRLAFCAGVAAKVARFSLTICHGGKSGGVQERSRLTPDLGRKFVARTIDEAVGVADRDGEPIWKREQPFDLSVDDVPRIAGCPKGGAIWKWTLRMPRNSSGVVRSGRSSFAIHGGTPSITKSSAPSSCCVRSKSSETARSPLKRTALRRSPNRTGEPRAARKPSAGSMKLVARPWAANSGWQALPPRRGFPAAKRLSAPRNSLEDLCSARR